MIRTVQPRAALLALAGLLALAACGTKDSPAPAPSKKAAAEPQATHLSAADLALRAEAADRADGKEDGIVSNCVTCGLAMSGSPDQAVEAHGKTFHLCSPGCKASFTSDPDAALEMVSLDK